MLCLSADMIDVTAMSTYTDALGGYKDEVFNRGQGHGPRGGTKWLNEFYDDIIAMMTRIGAKSMVKLYFIWWKKVDNWELLVVVLS